MRSSSVTTAVALAIVAVCASVAGVFGFHASSATVQADLAALHSHVQALPASDPVLDMLSPTTPQAYSRELYDVTAVMAPSDTAVLTSFWVFGGLFAGFLLSLVFAAPLADLLTAHSRRKRRSHLTMVLALR